MLKLYHVVAMILDFPIHKDIYSGVKPASTIKPNLT